MNTKKKILIISYSYPPSNVPSAQRPFSLAKYLDKDKYNVTVITCSNADTPLGIDSSFNESLPKVKLIKIKTKFGSEATKFRNSGMADTKNGLLANIKNKLFLIGASYILPDKAIFWYPNVIKYLKRNKEIINNTDVVFTTSPLFTNHLIGKYIVKKNKAIRWVADFRDFHFVENWSKKNGVKSFFNKKIELNVIKNANVVTFISEAMMNVYSQFYIGFENKFKFIYNGFDLDDFKELKFSAVDNKKFTIFYAGTFYKGVRSPFPLLELLDKIIEKGFINKNEICIKLAGNFEQELIEEAKQFVSFSCIEFLGRIPRSEVLKQITKADLLWLIVGNDITHYTGVPIKFYEYLAGRRPIINFAPKLSEPSKIIKEFNLGLSFDPKYKFSKNDVERFINLINSINSGDLKEPLAFNLIQKFTRDYQAIEFEKLIDG